MQIFVIIWFVLFFWIIGKGIAQFIENENSPVLTGPATIVDMRRNTHHHHSNGHHHHTHSYHITFEKEGGKNEYGGDVHCYDGDASFFSYQRWLQALSAQENSHSQ